jgi:fibronectin type 3 domain-containing protein
MVLIAVFLLRLSGCSLFDSLTSSNVNKGNDDVDDNDKNPVTVDTCVRFVNNNDFSVSIYMDISRLSKFAELGPNTSSNPIVTEPNANAVFYPSYHILIDNIDLPYQGEGLPVRVDEKKTTDISVPLLSELSQAELTKPLTSRTYLKLQNASTSGLTLRRGNYEEIPQGMGSSIVNNGETVYYLLSSGPTTNYSFMKNTTNAVAFPSEPAEFKANRLYSFKFDGNSLILLADRLLTIGQAFEIWPPENISAKSLANGHISLVWDKAGTAATYRIYRAESGTDSYSVITTVNGVSYTDTSVSIGTTYDYRISSIKNNIEGEKSSVFVSIKAEIGTVSAPVDLRVSGQTANSVSLSWTAVSDATGYKIYKGASVGEVSEYVATAFSASYTVNGLTAATVYYFTVSTLEGTMESTLSTPVSATTSASLTPPSGLNVSGQTANSISLSWTAVSGVTGYRIYRLSGSSYSQIGTTSLTTYTDTGLTASTAYSYRVVSYNGQNESDPASVSGTTSDNGSGTISPPPAKSTGLVVSSASSSGINLSWTGVANADSYDIYRSNTKDGTAAKIGSTAETSYTDNTVGAGSAYFYSVKGVNASGSSPYSDKAFAYVASHYALPTYGESYLESLEAGDKRYYRLQVSAGQNITITWQNGSNQNSHSDVRVAVWQNDGTNIFSNAYSGYTSPRAFKTTLSGFITIEVTNISGGSLDYQIYYH